MRKNHSLDSMFLLAAMSALLSVSCKHDAIEFYDYNEEINRYVSSWNDSIKSSIDPTHDWNTSTSTIVTVSSDFEGTLRIFTNSVFGNATATLVTQDIEPGETTITIARPQNATKLYAVLYDADGYVTEMPFDAVGEEAAVAFHEQTLPDNAEQAKVRSIASYFNFANEMNDYKTRIPSGTPNSNSYKGANGRYKVNKSDAAVNLWNGYCELYFGDDSYNVKNQFYVGNNTTIYLLPGANVKVRELGGWSCRVFVAEGATLDLTGVYVNTNWEIYNRGTIKADYFELNNNAIMFNNGTMTTGEMSCRNQNSQLINAGTASMAKLTLEGSSHMKNMGTINVAGLTTINSNNASWVNDGLYKTYDWKYEAGSNDVINNCRLMVENNMTISLGDGDKQWKVFKMDGGSYVETKTLLFQIGYITMGSGTMMKVNDKAFMNVTKPYYGFYGEGAYGSLPALLQAKEIVKGDMWGNNQYNANYITYSGNLVVATDRHFEQGENGPNNPFYWLTNGAKMARSQNEAGITIPKTECSEGNGGEDEPTTPTPIPTMTYFYAFEDMGGIGDFDFNDVVLGASAPVNGKTTITLYAAGGTLDTQIYLGTKVICNEVHEAFGVSQGTMVNTWNRNDRPYQVIGSYDIPNGQTPATLDLAIKVNNGYRSVTIEPNKELGKVPLAITINGSESTGIWNWPAECENITHAYPQFFDWVADKNTDIDWWK